MVFADSVVDILTAIGTCGAVIVSLCYRPIARFIRRPKINIEFDNAEPCVEAKEESSESPDSVKKITLRVRITNNGSHSADYASVNVDTYYEKRSKDTSYFVRHFTPMVLKDFRGKELRLVAPNLVYYLDVATVEQYESRTTEDEKGVKKQFYKLYLLGDGKNATILGKGLFVIPLKFYSSSTDTKIAYLQIYWDSDDYTTDERYFYAKLLKEKEFKNLEGVQK